MIRFTSSALFWIRWATVLALLVVTLLEPLPTRFGWGTWVLVLLFAAYNFLTDILGRYWSWDMLAQRRALLDLGVVALLYAIGPQPGGPLFVLFFLVVVCAAAALPAWPSISYTLASAMVVALVDIVFLQQMPDGPDNSIQQLGPRLLVLTLAGAGVTVLSRRLVLEKEIARHMRDEAERLLELDRLRDNFVATVSHELLTPVTAIRATLGLLETSATEQLGEEQLELLHNARRNTTILQLLIADLLAYNQIQSGRFTVEFEPMDLRDTVLDAVSILYPLFQQKAQQVELDLPVPLPVQGDSQRLQQVILNLLANAHQHTPTGTCVLITGQREEAHLLLVFQDNGPGFSDIEAESIFDRFAHGKDSKGSGLGLTIAREIVELHGGEIWADSVLENGARFWICLPIATGERAT